MKLRNKKTGEIVEAVWWDEEVDELCVGGDRLYFYNSLAELNEEWEDYEEPKEWFYIDVDGEVGLSNDTEYMNLTKAMKQIGNYFETKEEAKKAVEKLKAWKRLKDKGFEFIEGRSNDNYDFILRAKMRNVGLIDQQDIILLFGGSEK